MNAANLVSVRDDAQAIQDYLSDLKHWEKDIKKEDKRLLALQKEKPSMNIKDSTPIRCQRSSTDSKDDGPQEKEFQSVAGVKEGKKRILCSDYAAWDKYDAEAAVDTIEKQARKLACGDDRLQTASLDNSPCSTSDKDKLKAIQLKDEGNRLYSAGQYPASVTQYSQGLALDPSNHILYANRAMAYIKLERLEAAVHDCDACLRLSPNYLKAWLRRGAARLSLGQLQHALEDYQKVLEVEPWNKDAKEKVGEIKKKMFSTTSPHSDSKKKNIKLSPNSSMLMKQSSKDKDQKTSENSAKRDKIAARLDKQVLADTDPLEMVNHQKRPIPNSDPDVLQPALKPLHFRSQEPLRKLQIVDVACEGDIPPLKLPKRSDGESAENVTQTSRVSSESSPSSTDCSSNQPHEITCDDSSSPLSALPATPTILSLPKTPSKSPESSSLAPLQIISPQSAVAPFHGGASELTPSLTPSLRALPRTSHQFMSSWSKVASQPLAAFAWLQIIKPSSIRGFELEADCIVSIATTFSSWLDLSRQPQAKPASSLATAVVLGDPVSVRQTVRTYLEAVTESRSFELNALFLTSQDKKCVLSLLSDLETDPDGLPPKLAATRRLLTE